MALDIGVFLAALGITTLELVEAAAVALALYGDSTRRAVFGYVSLGILVVLIPTLLLGKAIALLPIVAVHLLGGGLLLYFGLRLIRSARRSVLRQRIKTSPGEKEEFEKGLFYTGFSVGAIEAFEAAIVLVALLPSNYFSTLAGLAGGIVIVVASTFVLRNQVRKVKQANMKVIVSAILLSFSVLWFAEVIYPDLGDIVLLPLFVAFALIVYTIANRPSSSRTKTTKNQPSSEIKG